MTPHPLDKIASNTVTPNMIEDVLGELKPSNIILLWFYIRSDWKILNSPKVTSSINFRVLLNLNQTIRSMIGSVNPFFYYAFYDYYDLAQRFLATSNLSLIFQHTPAFLPTGNLTTIRNNTPFHFPESNLMVFKSHTNDFFNFSGRKIDIDLNRLEDLKVYLDPIYITNEYITIADLDFFLNDFKDELRSGK